MNMSLSQLWNLKGLFALISASPLMRAALNALRPNRNTPTRQTPARKPTARPTSTPGTMDEPTFHETIEAMAQEIAKLIEFLETCANAPAQSRPATHGKRHAKHPRKQSSRAIQVARHEPRPPHPDAKTASTIPHHTRPKDRGSGHPRPNPESTLTLHSTRNAGAIPHAHRPTG